MGQTATWPGDPLVYQGLPRPVPTSTPSEELWVSTGSGTGRGLLRGLGDYRFWVMGTGAGTIWEVSISPTSVELANTVDIVKASTLAGCAVCITVFLLLVVSILTDPK